MRRSVFFAAVAAVMAFCSCSPVSYVLELEHRASSHSGLDLSGKSMALVYLESANGCDSLFNNRLADVLTMSLEDSFFDGEQGVGLYNLVKDPAGDYASADTASAYVMLLDTDVIMILDTPVLSDTLASGNIRELSTLYVYDSMSPSDEVVALQCKSTVSSLEDVAKAVSVGSYLSAPLMSQWRKDYFEVLYFNDVDSAWFKAVEHAYNMDWEQAMKIWMEFSRSKSFTKAGAAQYNMALACFLNGRNDLAKEWLDMADSNYPCSASRSLREKLTSAR